METTAKCVFAAARQSKFFAGVHYSAQLLQKASVCGFKEACDRSKVVLQYK